MADLFSVSDPVQGTIVEALVATLKDRSLLIVLDGCEHLQNAVLGLLTAVLKGCSEVKFLCTSLVPLGHPQERVFNLLPLIVPAQEDDSHPES